MDEIYLVTSPSWELGKANIKIGCSKDSKERKKKYDTHNPEAAFVKVFQTPSRAFSMAIEDAFLAKIRRHRVSSSEWYRVDKEFYDKFCALDSLVDVIIFTQFHNWLNTEINIYESRFELKEINKNTYTKKIQTLESIKRQAESL